MLIELIIGLVVIALVYWVIGYLQLPDMVKKVAIVLLVIGGIIWLLRFVPSLK